MAKQGENWIGYGFLITRCRTGGNWVLIKDHKQVETDSLSVLKRLARRLSRKNG